MLCQNCNLNEASIHLYTNVMVISNKLTSVKIVIKS